MADDTTASKAIAYYNAARAEVVQRLTLREQTLTTFLTVSGVIAGIAYRAPATPQFALLLLIPIVSIPFVLMFVLHDGSIRRIGYYTRQELRPVLAKDVIEQTIVDWDTSSALNESLKLHVLTEKCIFALVMTGPSVLALLVAHHTESPYHLKLIVFDCLATFLVLVTFAVEVIRALREL